MIVGRHEKAARPQASGLQAQEILLFVDEFQFADPGRRRDLKGYRQLGGESGAAAEDAAEPRRNLRVTRAHLVQEAVRVIKDLEMLFVERKSLFQINHGPHSRGSR
jgi:hypothetical protein